MDVPGRPAIWPLAGRSVYLAVNTKQASYPAEQPETGELTSEVASAD